MNELLIKLDHFFMNDMKIKKEMNNICPPNDNQYLDEDSIIKYLDDTFDSLNYIFTELKTIAFDLFNESPIYKKICLLENNAKDTFMRCGTDIHKLRKAYEILISDMSLDFLNAVKKECIGYTFSGFNQSIEKANTVNELLHFFHSYVINNDRLLQAIPEISKKENNYKYPVTLRGVSTTYFNQLFEAFPLELDCGDTEMVAINDSKMVMMVRDRGHALTIEITLNNDKARMEYFIPKICNVDMVNNLPGINTINNDKIGTTGIIEIDKSELNNVLFNFISMVPMDSDMVFSERYR